MAKTAIYSIAILMIALAASTGIIFAKQSQDQSTSTIQPLLQTANDACPCGGDCACQANGEKCGCGQNSQTCLCSGQLKCHAKTNP